ncbi:peptidase P60 [Neomegalonema sp.]|uniref:peptidase P60 n=1 Tax=Neomegalonema sp. TaxID=2039713 RepID=UPI00261C052E|nr:peptidase P60 [Neomegalonema sp.]MDD2870298.1 peptidase P60 [Neomegalonema sp.]
MNPDRVIAEARLWIGTPYVHGQASRGAGCDCLGLLRGVWRALYGEEPEPCPPYAPDWAAAGRDTLHEAADRWLAPAEEGPGAVALFRLGSGPVANHCAILSGEGRLIHATNARAIHPPRVLEAPMGVAMTRRAVGFWRFP